MESSSIPLGALCESKRGVEMGKAGDVIKCPGCMRWTTPPRWPEPDKEKDCPHCDHTFEYRDRLADEQLATNDPNDGDVAYIHGDSFGARYDKLETFGLKRGYDGIRYKDESLYRGDKLFVREAGVGFTAAYDNRTAYCPRSVYVFKIRGSRSEIVENHSREDGWLSAESIPDLPEPEAFHKFLHGVMNSRLFNYYVFKRFSEVDGAQSFANLRMGQIRSLPIPIEQLATEEGESTVEAIAERVDRLREGDAELGGTVDLEIERRLLDLYGLSNDALAHVNEQMGLAAYHKKLEELYPDGQPSRPEQATEVSLSAEADD